MPAPLPANSIFICYRRLDAEDAVDRIYSEIAPQFTPGAIFRDVDSIPPGTLFPAYIARCLHGCPVVLVFIGRDWLDARDERGQRRLDDPADHVRIEIETALALPDARVIPVLVRRAEMPAEDQLPESLRSLRLRSGVFIRGTGADYKHDVEVLAHVLRRSVEEVLAERRATTNLAPASKPEIEAPADTFPPSPGRDIPDPVPGPGPAQKWYWIVGRFALGAALNFIGGFLAIGAGLDLANRRAPAFGAGIGACGMAVFYLGLRLWGVGPGSAPQPRPFSRKAWGIAVILLSVFYVVCGFQGDEYGYLAVLLGAGLAVAGILIFRGKLGAGGRPMGS